VTAIRLADVWFSYAAVPVVKGVSIAVQPGEAVALLGPNGAGKTTLTKLLVALLHPSRGEVCIAGASTAGRAPEDLARVVAYLFQHSDQQLFARTTMNEVAFGPRRLGRTHAEAWSDAATALSKVGLSKESETHPYDLPAAKRKLVGLAAALAQRPRVLVLDEPTQGLDFGLRERVGEVVRRVAAEEVTVLAVTHDLAFVAEAFDRALVMVEGAIVADEPARSLIADEPRALSLGLAIPPAATLSRALALPGTPVRIRDVVDAMRGRAAAP